MKVLIIKLGALGDVVNSLPLAVLLKEKLKASIHWLVAPLSFPLLEKHEAVEKAILFQTKSGPTSILTQVNDLRDQKYDLVLDLQRILKSGLLCSAVRGRRRVGFDRNRCKELTWLLPFERIPASDPHAHMVHQYLEFARYLGIKETPVEWRIKGIGKAPEGLPSEFIVLNIGATKPANRWTVEGFSRLSRIILERYGLASVLTGGPEDSAMALKIQEAEKGNIYNTVGRTSLLELISILEKARLVVTCDTGPMHLSVALGKRVVALFGPSDHRRTGPYRGKVVRAKVDCAPCSTKKCEDNACMSLIRAEDVVNAINGCES
jgi:ADP-heptose:LPS heptosyltransferase